MYTKQPQVAAHGQHLVDEHDIMNVVQQSMQAAHRKPTTSSCFVSHYYDWRQTALVISALHAFGI